MDEAGARARLRSVRILAVLSDEDLDALAASIDWIEVSPGDEVLPHLAAGQQVYFVIEGVLDARLETAAGRDVAIRQLNAGSHFGEIAALTNAPRSLNIVARSSGLIAECPAERFLALMRRNGAFAQAIATSLARNVILLTDRVFELAALEVRFRIYAELLRLARSAEQVADGLLIKPAPTHEKIAASVGATREAVTRELRSLAGEGVVRQGKRELVISDIARLRDLVQRRAGMTITQLVDWDF